jgi:hypothetical protein
MRILGMTLFLVALITLAGCDPTPTPEPTPVPEVDPDPVPEPEVLQGAILEPLDKARAVEDAVLEAKKAQDEQIKEQGG